MLFILLSLLITCCSSIQFSATPVLITGVQDFDGLVDNSSVIVVGSVIQLFCSASGQLTAPHIQWTRNSITIPETAQLPHLMVKSRTQNNTITSSLLTIYGFSSSDKGSYQCVVSESDNSSISQPLLLSAIRSNGSNVLKIVRELSNNTADRTSVPLGSSDISSNGGFLRCSAEQPASSSLTAPSMMWLKDGTQLFGDGVRVVINTTNPTIGTSNRTSNRTVSFVRIFNFSQSDAGVYQCVFYDTPSQGGEVITTRPYKVDTGPVSLIASSPSVITKTDPTASLVIQVEAGGEYAGIQLTRTPIALNVSNGELVDFQQTFVMNVTSEGDWGLYTVRLVNSSNWTLASVNIYVNSSSLSFYPTPSVQPSASVYGGTSSISPYSSTSSYSSSISSTPDSTSTPSPSPLSVSSSDPVVVVVILVTTVPISVLAILLILVASLLSGMAMVRCYWGKRRKDHLQISNPMAMLSFQNSSDTSSNGKWSLQETGHALHLSGPCSSQEDSSALSDFPSTPNHTYEALPSLPPRQPIFEDLTGSFDCLPVMKSNVNVGLYSVIGPIESEGESSSPVLSGVAQYSEPQCEGMGTRQALPHAPSTPTHEVVEPNFQFNPQCSSSPWSPPSVDLNWYRASP
ncbi:hypothetical protein EMCRGX_G013755 [Ephydatia muelleri]